MKAAAAGPNVQTGSAKQKASKPILNFFELREGFPQDWKTHIPAFNTFFKERHHDIVYKFYSYPGLTVAEIGKAANVGAAFSEMLDQMR